MFLKKLGIEAVNAGVMSGHTWSGSEAGRLLVSQDPTTEDSIASVQTCKASDYEILLQRTDAAFKIWREVPAPKRGEVIREMGNALRVLKSELGALVSLEMGKSKQEGEGEVQEMIDMADFAVGQSRMLYGKTMHSERACHRMYEQWHPYGIVGVISAFNFPVAVWAWNAFLAAICGNVTIWKPSSKTPLCAVAVQKICNQVLKERDLPPIFGFFVPEDRALSEQFIADSRVGLISFTGSTSVGRHVSETVARRLGRSLLELGGNNAVIIDESADLTLAIPAVVFGAVGTAGQRCTSIRRLIVHSSIEHDIVARLKHAYEQITIGDPLDEKNLMGPLIDKQAVDQYLKAIAEIVASGGEIVHGGKALQRTGFYVEPTLVTHVRNDWPIVQEETFAPILYVISYKRLEEAIALHNGVRQGLSSAIFTADLKRAEYFLSASGSDCGIANVNIGTSGAEIGGAFGGEKDTGGGRESGSDAWQVYMRRQTNTINWGNTLPLAQGIRFTLKN